MSDFENRNGLYVPKEKEEPKQKHTFMATYHHHLEHGSVEDILRKQGADVFATVVVPFYNIYGQIISHQYAVVYQAEKELGFEELT